jgi:hypothetical protein
MVYISRIWIARIKEDGSLNTRFPAAIFLFIPNIILSLTVCIADYYTFDRAR